MTDAELDHLEALFRHPPSCGVLAEHGLRLIAELRLLKAAHAAFVMPTVDELPPSRARVGDVMQPVGEAPIALDPPPTPDLRPAKKGKR